MTLEFEVSGRSLVKATAIACLASTLLLAGCGGSSDPQDPPDPSMEEQQIAALEAQIAELRTQLGLPADGDVGATVAELQAQLKELQDAKAAAVEMARMDAEAALMALAKKLHTNIDDLTNAVISVAAGCDSDGTLQVARVSGNPVDLSVDKEVMVAALSGWEGMKLTTAPTGDGAYEAVVYSIVDAPTQGKKFGGAAADDEFQYALVNGAVAMTVAGTGLADAAAIAAQVGLTGVTRTAGTETFKLPDPNPGGSTIILVLGSFHGVSGTYSCTPSTPADGCSAAVAASSFTLAGGTWKFTPSDANVRVTDSPDTNYASYGWWIYESEDGETFNASAFNILRGTVPAAAGITALLGTAPTRAAQPASTLSTALAVGRTTSATSLRTPRSKPTSMTTRSPATSTTSRVPMGCRGIGPSN